MKYLLSDNQACSTWKESKNEKGIVRKWALFDARWSLKVDNKRPKYPHYLDACYVCNFVESLSDEPLDHYVE